MVKLTDEQRRYYASRNKRLLNAARAGVPYTELAPRFGISEQHVSKITIQAG